MSNTFKVKPNHQLKTIQPFFKQIWNGLKEFEIRSNDRDFKPLDIVQLNEYDPITNSFTGAYILIQITYLIRANDYLEDQKFNLGLMPGFCVFSFEILSKRTD